jgi:hypothetical protein
MSNLAGKTHRKDGEKKNRERHRTVTRTVSDSAHFTGVSRTVFGTTAKTVATSCGTIMILVLKLFVSKHARVISYSVIVISNYFSPLPPVTVRPIVRRLEYHINICFPSLNPFANHLYRMSTPRRGVVRVVQRSGLWPQSQYEIIDIISFLILFRSFYFIVLYCFKAYTIGVVLNVNTVLRILQFYEKNIYVCIALYTIAVGCMHGEKNNGEDIHINDY